MEVIEFDQKKKIKETIEDVLKESDSLQCIVVLGLYKDSSQMLRTSHSSAMEKSFLLAFFHAWMNKWFMLGDDQ